MARHASRHLLPGSCGRHSGRRRSALRRLLVDVQFSDFITIGLLVLLEGLLSADNALVLAILVLALPKSEQKKALRYGILGAFFFRIVAIAFASQMITLAWVKLAGGLYLLYLPYQHFFGHDDPKARRTPVKAQPWLGLSAFWATVVKVELTDIVFAIDSILAAVALSGELWVVITGGILGIIAMRLVIGQLLVVVQRYPAIVDGAFVIIGWVGIKLFLEYLNQKNYIHFEIPKAVSLGLIVVIFTIAFVYARMQGATVTPEEEQDAAKLIYDEDELGRG